MKKLGMISLLVIILLITSVFAQELPGPGITPDSWLYGLDKAFESLQMALTFDPVAKAGLHIQFAGERLAEAKAMIEKGRPEFVPDLVKEHEGNIDKSNEIAAVAQQVGRNITKLNELVALATSVHIETLEEIYEKVPDQAKPAVLKAKEVSARGQEEALRRLGEVIPERSAELYFEIGEKRLMEAREKARETKAGEATELVEEYEDKISKSQEMIEKAEDAGRNVTEVVERVSVATSTHLLVLQEVYDRVPEEAKEAIERAMNVSAKGQEEALKALEKEMPERAEEIEGAIPEEVRQIREDIGRTETIIQPEAQQEVTGFAR